jgi:NTE family protein
MKNTVALTLSGGGARGMAHIGVIEELEKRGYTISSMSGSSIGSVIAGAYATSSLQDFKEWIVTFGKMDVIRMMDFIVGKNGLIKGEKVLSEMKKIFPDKQIENLPIPVSIIGTDLASHQEVVFESGSLYEAIRASIAIPTVFTPLIKGEMVLVDGGVINPFPMNRIKRQPGDILIGVNLNHHGAYEKPINFTEKSEETHNAYVKTKEFINEKWSSFFGSKQNKHKKMGFFDVLTSSMWLYQEKITEQNIEIWHPDVLVNISRHACDIFAFHRAEELIEYGRQQAAKVLDTFENKKVNQASQSA